MGGIISVDAFFLQQQQQRGIRQSKRRGRSHHQGNPFFAS
jgi:hypothetical protein